jgi:hypothetical protein
MFERRGGLLFVNKKKQKNFFTLSRAGFSAAGPNKLKFFAPLFFKKAASFLFRAEPGDDAGLSRALQQKDPGPEGRLNMGACGLLRPFRVPGGDAGDDQLVFIDGLCGASFRTQSRHRQKRKRQPQVLKQGREVSIARRIPKLLMEDPVGTGELVGVGKKLTIPGDHLLQEIDLNGRRMDRGKLGGRPLENLAHVVEFGNLRIIERGDDDTMMWLVRDEPLRLQTLKGFANGRTADGKPLRQLALAESRAWHELA